MQDGSALTLFALNRHLTEPMPLEVDLRPFPAATVRAARLLHNQDLEAANTKLASGTVQPAPLTAVRIADQHLQAALPPASWSMIRLGLGDPER